MSDAALAARATDALVTAADAEAGVSTSLVSLSLERLAAGEAHDVATHVVRKTRTLTFMRADIKDAAGATIAIASSVHKAAG
ncbi:MAG: hypothetical protein AB7O98_04580 [Hyphomonadaceae bacterium]